jgi:hypothetical protein
MKPYTRLSQMEVTGKYAVKIVMKHAESGTMMKVDVIIYATNIYNNTSP